METLLAVLAAVFGIVVGYLLRNVSARGEKTQADRRVRELAERRAGFESLCMEREKTIGALNKETERLRGDLESKAQAEIRFAAHIRELEADLRNERQNMTEKVALLETAKQSLAAQFQALAGEILDQKSKAFAEESHKDLGNVLSPLRDQIKEFREKVEQAQSDSKDGVTTLRTLIGNLGTMNQQLSEEARNLSTALRGSAKAQGDWGEFILRDLLDKAGLREGDEYKFQQSFTGIESEEGDRTRTVRTDVLLYLPGGRHLIIDSKVSLNAYTDCVNAVTDEARKAALKLHVSSVRGHIAGLAKAGYHRLPDLEAPDFVVMFVSIEPAFLMALQADS